MIRILTLTFALLAAPAASPELSWQRQACPVKDDLHNAFFVDDKQGWILTHQSGAVLHTADGGANWQVQARLGEGFLESIHGGLGTIIATSDGGRPGR